MIVKMDLGSIHSTTWQEYATRFVFGGTVTLLGGLIADKFGPGVGGLFLAFPAIFPASASLIEKRQREKKKRAGVNGAQRGRLAAGVGAAGAAMCEHATANIAADCLRVDQVCSGDGNPGSACSARNVNVRSTEYQWPDLNSRSTVH